MGDDPDGERKGTEESRFRRSVRDKAQRRIRGRSGADQSVWYWLGMFGLVGWAVAIPTLVGIAVGVWLDRHWGDGISWTLSLLFIGVVVGCLHAWYWVTQERRRR